MNYKIAIVGAGNIGSRHLQALAKVNYNLAITVIDPSNEALKLANERYNEVSNNPCINVRFENNLDSIEWIEIENERYGSLSGILER